jgi:hypothetical protein
MREGARVFIVARDDLHGRAIVIGRTPGGCGCGGDLYRVRIESADDMPTNTIAEICANALRRPN